MFHIYQKNKMNLIKTRMVRKTIQSTTIERSFIKAIYIDFS